MKEFMNLVEDYHFKNFILNSYIVDHNLSDEDKLNSVCASLYDYAEAMEAYKNQARQAA